MKRHFLLISLATLLLPVSMFARAEGHFDRTLTVSGAVELDLTTGSGEVNVKTGGSNQVVIHGTVRSSNDWWGGDADGAIRSVESNPPIAQSGNSIRVGFNLPEDAKRHVSIAYEVTVPPDTTLQVNTGSGEISVEGIRSPSKLAYGFGKHSGARPRSAISAGNRQRQHPCRFGCRTGLREYGQWVDSRRLYGYAGTSRCIPAREESTSVALAVD